MILQFRTGLQPIGGEKIQPDDRENNLTLGAYNAKH